MNSFQLMHYAVYGLGEVRWSNKKPNLYVRLQIFKKFPQKSLTGEITLKLRKTFLQMLRSVQLLGQPGSSMLRQ